MPEQDESWKSADTSLTKLEIASRHVTASIQMIAAEVNPLSIQLLVMAADTIIQDTARHQGVLLPYGDSVVIKPEYLKDWIVAKRRAVNFAKHADRDPDQIYDGPKVEVLPHLNDIQTVMNIIGLQSLGITISRSMSTYFYYIATLYPNYMKWEELFAKQPALRKAYAEIRNPSRSLILGALRMSLKSDGLFP